MSANQPHRFKTITEFHQFRALPKPEHPLISVIDVTQMNDLQVDELHVIKDFYSIALKRNLNYKVKYGQKLLQASDAMPGEANSASAGSLALRTAMGAVIDGALAKDSLDAILAPGASYANAGASAGYPTVIVPAGLVSEKTATGISFMGTAWSEATLLRIAAAYEAGSHRRVPPTVVNDDLITHC